MDISEKILRLRKKHSMTREKLAMRVGVGAGTVEKWEKGLLKPSDAERRRLSNVFNIEQSYFSDKRPPLTKVLAIHLDRITKRHKSAVLATAVVSLIVAFIFVLMSMDHLMLFFSTMAILSLTVSVLAFVLYSRNKKG